MNFFVSAKFIIYTSCLTILILLRRRLTRKTNFCISKHILFSSKNTMKNNRTFIMLTTMITITMINGAG
jgi:hypothetical protein